MVDRVDSLEKYVGEFWSAVHDSVKGLKAADEIDLGSTKVIVVEATADVLTIHVGGQNRRYQVNQLPSGLAVGLAVRTGSIQRSRKTKCSSARFISSIRKRASSKPNKLGTKPRPPASM